MDQIVKEIFSNYWKNIKDKPSEHSVLFGVVISFFVGMFSWQYCSGYFNSLGINISFNHIDNLIFTFKQLINIKFPVAHLEYKMPTYLFLGGVFIHVTIALYKKYLEKELVPAKERAPELEYWISVVVFYPLLISMSFIFSAKPGSLLALFPPLVAIITSCGIYVKQVYRGNVGSNSWIPIIVVVVVILFFRMANELGKQDGERLRNEHYRSLHTVCLSKLEDMKGEFIKCGKLVYEDSSRICIKEKVPTYPICRKRDKYETTLIP